MSVSRVPYRPLPLFTRLVGLALAGGLLVLGIIGLILPVIPGLVFLFLALFVMTRLSRRVAAFAHRQPWFARHAHPFQRASGLSVGRRLALGSLVLLRSVMQGMDAAYTWVQSAGRR